MLGGMDVKIEIANDSIKQQDYILPKENRRRVDMKETPKEIETLDRRGLREEEQKQETREDVIKAIEKANEQIRLYDKRLEFSIHDKTNKIMIKVVNSKDDSVISEIPSEKVLNMVANIWEMSGVLVDERR